MKKFLLLLLGFILATLTFFSCKKEEDEGPGYYFRFQADGVDYDYKYECEDHFFSSRCNMGGAPSGTSVTVSYYYIYGFSLPYEVGRVTFELNKSDFATLDTIILDGSRNLARSKKLDSDDDGSSGNSLRPPLLGRLIITERGESHLKGTFEFDAYRKEFDSTGFSKVTDSVVHFSSGSFYVPARFE